jgi:hypothetical protein
MPVKEKETVEVTTVAKKSNGAASRYKAKVEEVTTAAKDKVAKANAKLREARESGRFGRAVVDTVEAGIGGAIGGALDGFGLDIPIGEAKTYAYFEVVIDEKTGKPSGVLKDAQGNETTDLNDAERGLEQTGPSIPAALPLGLVAVGVGAYAEQADAVEIGKGMVAYSVGRLACDGAKAVRDMF